VAAVFVMSVILIVRHRANIANLLRGTESRIGGSGERKGAGSPRR
jgi:glycerol-3-phosphate acyltransferase PlsY